MKVLPLPGNPSSSRRVGAVTRLLPLVIAVVYLFLSRPGQAATSISLDSPTAFFTNLAAHLLKSELNLDLNNIQIYPTNQYTPSVHRLLQVTANLYDSITNRALGLSPEYPYCPSIFRPLFRRVVIGTNTCIVIAGYREVINTGMADPSLAPQMIDLYQPNPFLGAFPAYGTPFDLVEKNEPMVSGVPLVIGAKKGFPNLNEFSMQTQVLVSRLLEFRRAPGDPNGPVVRTNQMYVIGVSNTFGLEAWNSYLTNYPRDLNLIASVMMTAVMTNETGTANVVFSNTIFQGASLTIPANSWSGWTALPGVPSSMVLPFGNTNGFFFLTNSTALDYPPWLEPQTHIFPITMTGSFYVPHWWLNLITRVLFVLVDTNANRIVDYVNLEHAEPTLDITAQLAVGSTAASNPVDYKNPANEWITNRLGNSPSPNTPTYGVMNQILVGLSGLPSALTSYTLDPYSGLDIESAVDGFRFNLAGLYPIYAKDFGKTFYKSNVFYAPLDPYRTIYIHTSWQANDPLVHYMVNDLLNFSIPANQADFVSHIPPLDNLGQINNRYAPWGGNPIRNDPMNDFQVAVKDPGITRPDDWDFPANQPLGIEWVGRVHRGTPWQTIFLKSTNILDLAPGVLPGLLTWVKWTGDSIVGTYGDPPSIIYDANRTVPTNDWHLVSVLNALFNTNDAHRLASPNAATLENWEALLDGIVVLSNSAPGQVTAITMSSNSPQAALVAEALLSSRTAQPAKLFRNVGDILATPELSVASPWLGYSTSVTDEVLEAIPSQLLGLLRPDSIGAIEPGSGSTQIQFTGMDGYSYAVQVSSDLLNWTPVSTNIPENGMFNFAPAASVPVQFYRSVLEP